MRAPSEVPTVDPFDLPEWLGTGHVVWTALSGVHDGHLVTGELRGDGHDCPCDLLAADQAFPEPVVPDAVRRSVHQSWTHRQVLLVRYDGRLTLAVPGNEFSADLVLECVGRLAKAVGARRSQYAATLRL